MDDWIGSPTGPLSGRRARSMELAASPRTLWLTTPWHCPCPSQPSPPYALSTAEGSPTPHPEMAWPSPEHTHTPGWIGAPCSPRGAPAGHPCGKPHNVPGGASAAHEPRPKTISPTLARPSAPLRGAIGIRPWAP